MNNEYLEFAKDIAKVAGEIMLKYFNLDNGASYKEDQTIVTLADTEINKYLINRVKEKYPTHSVDGEEESFGKSNYVWVCDPVDGTEMYAKHIPVAVFSLALVIDGKPEIGVVYDPFMDNLYYGVKGFGAYKNNERIQVSNIDFEDKKSTSDFTMFPNASYNFYPIISELGMKTYFVSLGSVIRSCMEVATGNFNLVIFPRNY